MYATPPGLDGNRIAVPFATLLSRTHRASVRVSAQTPDGTVLAAELPATGGSVTVDRTAKFRRQCALTILSTSRDIMNVVTSLIPKTSSDLLSPFGNMVRIEYGIDLGAGILNWWQLGLFRISDASMEDSGEGVSISLTGYDIARTISRNSLTVPWIVTSGANWGDAIIALAKNRYPALLSRAHAVTATAGSTVVLDPEKDPWDAITEWAALAGCSAYFDNEGYLVVAADPNPATAPVSWEYLATGAADQNALFLGVSRKLSDDPGYNGVILTSESTTLATPLRSEAWDLDPSSGTYSLGAYGKVPKFVTNPFVATQGQADAAAAAELALIIGGAEQTSISVVPNPAHEAGDVIHVVRPAAGVNQTTVLESFQFPLGPDEAMRLSFRERRVA